MDSTVALIFSFLLLVVAYSIKAYISIDHSTEGRPPIVPSIIPWLGSAIAFNRNPIQFLQWCKYVSSTPENRVTLIFRTYRQKYGSVYMLRLAGQNIIIVSHPSGISSLHKDPKAFTSKPVHIHMLKVIAGITHNREHVFEVLHTRLYPQIVKTFSPTSMTNLANDIDERLRLELRAIGGNARAPTILKLNEFIGRPLYRAGCLCLFGPTFPMDTYDDFRLFDAKLPQLIAGLPFIARDGTQARQRLINKLEEYIKPMWAGEVVEGVSDAISTFMQEMRVTLTRREAASVLLSFVLGFHFNTWYMIFWLISHLLVDKDALERLVGELRLRGTTPSHGTPLMDSAVYETLRWATKTPTVRMAVNDTSIVVEGEPITVQKGDYVIADVRSVHYDPEVYPNPDKFEVVRFVNAGEKLNFMGLKPLSWGGGVHMVRVWNTVLF